MFAWHERTQTPLLAWSAQARGYFFGRDGSDVLRVYDNPVNRERRRRAEQLGERLGFTASQVALAWALDAALPRLRVLRRAHRGSGARGVRRARGGRLGARGAHGVTAPRMKSMIA